VQDFSSLVVNCRSGHAFASSPVMTGIVRWKINRYNGTMPA
jgi:hypothetical protein